MALHFAGGSKKKTTKKTKKQSNKTSDKTNYTPSLYKRQKVSVDTLVSRTWVRPLDPFDSRIIEKTFKGNCFIAPLNYKTTTGGDVGVFAATDIPEKTRLFKTGTFNVSHAQVCSFVGVESGTDVSEPKRKRFIPPKSIRHIYTFVQNLKSLKNEKDFGAFENIEDEDIKWLDLVANCSPSLFINSVSAQDGRQPNVEFSVDAQAVQEGFIESTRFIAMGEELLLSYMRDGNTPMKARSNRRKGTKKKPKKIFADE